MTLAKIIDEAEYLERNPARFPNVAQRLARLFAALARQVAKLQKPRRRVQRSAVAVVCFLFLSGCVVVKVPPQLSTPPMPEPEPSLRYLEIDLATNTVPNCKVNWDCGCGEPMSHWGHAFTVEWKPALSAPWQKLIETNRPPVEFPPGFVRVACHLGNWPTNGQP